MKYLLILMDNHRGERPSDMSVRAVYPFQTLKEAKIAATEWYESESAEAERLSGYVTLKATIWNLEKNFLIKEYYVTRHGHYTS